PPPAQRSPRFHLQHPAAHHAIPPRLWLRLQRELRSRLQLEAEDRKQPLGQQRRVGERPPHLLGWVIQVELEGERFALRPVRRFGKPHSSILSSSRSSRSTRSGQKVR